MSWLEHVEHVPVWVMIVLSASMFMVGVNLGMALYRFWVSSFAAAGRPAGEEGKTG